MTKVLRMLAGGGFAAVLGVVMLGLAGAFSAQTVEAQSPPSQPARFVGSVTVNGQPAAAGAVVVAVIDGVECGNSAVFLSGGEARYSIDVRAAAPGSTSCGVWDEEAGAGSTVSFTVSGEAASGTGEWRPHALNTVNLSVTSATPTATTTPDDDDDDDDDNGTATPTKTGTPSAPKTGTGVDAAGSNASLFAGLGIAALALGAAGAAAARRSR